MSIADRDPPVCPDWDLWSVFTMATRSFRAFSSSSAIRSFTLYRSFQMEGGSDVSVFASDEIVKNDFVEALAGLGVLAGYRPGGWRRVRRSWGGWRYGWCGDRLDRLAGRRGGGSGAGAEGTFIEPACLE